MAAPAIGLRPRSTPPLRAAIDPSHPLAAGLVSCVVPSGAVMRDVARGISLPRDTATAVAAGATAHGEGVRMTSAVVNSGWQWPDSGWVPTTAATVGFVMRKDDTTNRNSAAFGIIGSTRCGAHVPFSDGTVYWDFGGASNSAGGGRTQVSGAVFGNADVWVLTANSTGPTAIWQSGSLLVSTPDHGATRAAGGTMCIANGQSFADGSNSADLVTFGIFAIWNRVLTPSEIAAFTASPNAMVRY